MLRLVQADLASAGKPNVIGLPGTGIVLAEEGAPIFNEVIVSWSSIILPLMLLECASLPATRRRPA